MRCKFCHGQFSKCGRHLRNLRSWEKVIDNIDYHAKDYKKEELILPEESLLLCII